MKKSVKIILIITSLLLVAAALFCYLRFDLRSADSFQDITYTPDFNKPVPRLYGLPADSFRIESDKVGRDQNLGQILYKYSLPERALTQLLLYASDVFDVRKIRHGNNYTAFLSKDSLNRLQYFVYEHSPIEYVVFDFTDSVKVYLREREVITRQKKVKGEIITSLWDAVTQNNINPQIALELSEMYAWTVDFFGLQPGDHFTVVYDELYVDTVSIGIGRIHAASFNHAGKELVAIPFTQDSVETYFDAEGNSLRRAFLKNPLRYSRISSRFSGSRLHPILKIRRPHYGVDYAAPVGTPVYSIGDGRVIMAGYQSGSGRIVKVRHNGVYTSTYMHLSGFGKGITTGKYVIQGELLGYVGSSGLSTGPHLDFRVSRNGSPIDPLKMESPPVDPIKPENRLAFNSVKMATMDLLNDTEEEKMANEFIPTGLPQGVLQDIP